MYELDKWDKRIIYELDKDARASLSKIGNSIDKSKSFVQYRLDNLEKRKILTNFFIFYDYSKLGIESRSIFLKVFGSDGISRIIEYLRKIKNISVIYETTGEFKLVFSIKTKNKSELVKILEDLMTYFNKEIESYMIILSYKSYAPSHNYLYNDEIHRIEKIEEYNNSDYLKLDKKEKEVLDLVKKYPKMSMTELSIKLGCNIADLRNRYNSLVENRVIIDIRPNIDPLKLGFFKKIFLIKFKMVGFLHIERIKKYLLGKKGIIHLSFTLGSADMFFTCVFKNNDEYKFFESEFVNEFRDIIQKEIILDFFQDYFNVQKIT